ncbi:hypothetical protein FJZ33_09215 [Candidatus Poribacteria bacterium]|nr:hypothetical protein [Candidatus Poribacteria bacterium]
MRCLFVFVSIFFLLLYTQESLSQTAVSEKSPKSEFTMDGIMLNLGVYRPFHSEMKNIYGTGFTMGIQHCLNMTKSMDIVTSIGLIRKSGNPYYDVSTFLSERNSEIQIIPIEIGLRRRMVIMRNSKGFASRGIYGGAGINYIRAREEVPDILVAKGGDFGLQVFAGPQVLINNNLAFEGEIKMIMNSVNMKYRDKKYNLNLYGFIIKAIFAWYY